MIKIFEINPGLFVWSVLTFLVLVAALYKFAFNPLMRLQKARQDEIHQSIVSAEELRNEAQELLANYKRQMADARQQSEAILDRARKLSETSKAEVLEEARVQAEATLARAREQIETGHHAGAPEDQGRGGRPHHRRHREGHSEELDNGRSAAPGPGRHKRDRPAARSARTRRAGPL